MTGPKLNEGATVAGERAGTKASAKYVRSSARKARVVLDLIRGLDVRRADEVLQFTERGIARDVRKVLASAVANAVHNDGQDPEELFVLACFADEGPTLRRFRPRARGRASRINKRTCHITVIVARMSVDRLAVVQAREESSTSSRPTSASRRARVERSRQRAQTAAAEVDAVDADEQASDATDAAIDDTATRDTGSDAPYAGAALPLDDGSAPDGFEIKGNADSMLFHEPGTRYYEVTAAEVYFDTAESAEAAGFARPASVPAPAPYPGAALPLDDGSAPKGFEIKGNDSSMLFHEPGTRYYDATDAEVYFDSAESAEAAGFARPASVPAPDETADDTAADEEGTK